MKVTSKAPLFLKTKKVTKGLSRNIKVTRKLIVNILEILWFANLVSISSF
jgi:hypothetical protein